MWNIPTKILYAEKDNLTSLDTVTEFARSHNAPLTVMKDGEHWFHTKEQLEFLADWIKSSIYNTYIKNKPDAKPFYRCAGIFLCVYKSFFVKIRIRVFPRCSS